MTLAAEPAVDERGFSVHLTNFSGPFDLLLQLIGKHKLDITEVALSQVTDEFIAHLRQAQATQAWDLNETSQFIVVGATLLDLKAARLLPSGEVDDEEDLALLEARDLLFARLLQYRAFKLVSGWIAETLAVQDRRHPRPGGLEEQFAKLLPEVDLTGLADQLALLASAALAPKPPVEVALGHLHIPRVSVRDQAEVIIARLKEHPNVSFRALVADAEEKLVVVARFLALLELYREQAVAFEQLAPLGELTIRWLGAEVADGIGSEFDQTTDETTQESTDE
ncbi:MAG: ScpA family protein [Propionicimonas sp.]|uniref:segregation and condensation protein A n=1 Tax=Propionicimonas sp. TaxID=1955623 RepID=UPI002B1FDAC4|nr:ScpA family protein [Propionicimonas sp.]MEA4945759.1 ScpA family protein [Propionicimonas sp.]